jgi:hypothetical protein
MHTKPVYLFLLLGLASCARTINVTKVRDLFIEYNPELPNNYGTPIAARVGAHMKNGQVKYVTASRKLSTSSNVSFDLLQQTVSINSIPQTYETSEIPVKLTLVNSQGISVSGTDTLLLNFAGSLKINSHAGNAQAPSGKSMEHKGTPILFRDGRDGDNGLSGNNGLHGEAYEIHIWQEEKTTYVHVRNLTQGTTGKYQVSSRERIYINAAGTTGGDGGNGGNGGNGKDGVEEDGKLKAPGDGGNGGSGGFGGNGGNGGSITCILHPSASALRNRLILDVNGGSGGLGGSAGLAGKPGTSLAGQATGRNGSSGANGSNGSTGSNGEIQILEKAFYIADYL